DLDYAKGNREGGETVDDDEASGAVGSISGLVDFGADGPGATAFTINTTVLGTLPSLYSDGKPVTYSATSSTLTALDWHGNVVFTFAVNGDGSWTFDLDGR